VRRVERRLLSSCLLAVALVAAVWQFARAEQSNNDGSPAAACATPRRTPIIVGLPVPQLAESGEIALQPNVVVNGARPTTATGPARDAIGFGIKPAVFAGKSGSATDLSGSVVPAGGTMPPTRAVPASQVAPAPPATNMPLPSPFGPGAEELPPITGPGIPRAEPMFAQSIGDGCGCGPGGGHHGHHDGTFYGLGGIEEGSGDPGIGHERVMFALFEIPNSEPSSNMRFRFNATYDQRNPDRADFFWAQTGGRGPKLPERSVDYQDAIASWEVASGKAFSLTTEIPLRFVAPDINPNTGGLGDMSLTTKTVLLNGADWQITQIFRTELPTGDPGKGVGNGHVSLEPGFLFRLKWSPETYFHSQLTYWFPLGDNPVYGGQILKYGFGVSHLLYESDTFAAIPTLEFNGWTVLNGAQTTFPLGLTQPVDTMGIFNVRPGIRFVRDTGGDLGLFEWGVSGAFGITQNKWYDAAFLLEARFVF
jgi:hypothetical protein